ncbi:MAG: glycosyltransferase family 4 protein [Planctomycetes bacterium]|nr:glycosyltransferase family 4 protein [Planctomycetota bacterium]
MKQRGHDVEIFTRSDQNETVYHEGILVNRVKDNGFIFKCVNRLTRYRFRQTLNILSLSHCLRKSLLKRHRHQHFDIVQASSYLACGLFSTFCRPVPIISRISSYEPLWRKFYSKRLTRQQRFREWLELLALRCSNAVYAPSELLCRVLRENANIEADVLRPPFFIETNNLDESIYKKHLMEKKYLVFFGSIGLLKGGEALARSLPDLLATYPKMFFVFAGKVFGGPENKSMLDYIKDKTGRYSNQIIYLGVLPHYQLYPIVKYSQAVVLPSLIDNLPNTMLEAMALGKVVIGTRGSSFEEFIDDGISGILVEADNSAQLFRAMERVWNMSEEERINIGRVAQQRIASLSPEIACHKLEQYLQQFIRSR